MVRKVIHAHVSDLIPSQRNSRIHSDEQVNSICESIRNYGFINPVIIDEENNIIAGHGRLIAAKRLGLEKVPCIIADDLTDEQKRAYMIADNKIPQNSEWDIGVLKSEFEDLMSVGIELEDLGFSGDEIKRVFAEDEKLRQKDVEIKPIRWTHMLVSLPVSSDGDKHNEWLSDFAKRVVDSGGRVDYGGN